MVVRGASAGARRPSVGGAFGALLLLAAASSAKWIGQLRAQVPAPSRSSFARGADLPTLREHIDAATRDLSAAVSAEDYSRACVLRDRVSRLRSRDPQHRYSELSRALQAAIAAEDYSAARQLHDELLGVKNHLPQYQLAGLWRGLYPQQGEEIIRIQYARDDPNLLLAYKVTGDEYVPRGEITFTAELLHERTVSTHARDAASLSRNRLPAHDAHIASRLAAAPAGLAAYPRRTGERLSGQGPVRTAGLSESAVHGRR